MTNRGKQAVVLSGGGAKGAFEIGVMKALFSGASPATSGRRLDPQIFAGTSVGSYNAAFLVSRPDQDCASAVADLEEIWCQRIADNPDKCGNGVFRFRADPFPFLDPECLAKHPLKPLARLADDGAFFAQDWLRRGANFFTSSGSLAHRTLELLDLGSLISTEPMKRLVEETISLAEIHRSQRTLRMAATNWETGSLKIFENQELTDEIGHRAILASAAIPGIFPGIEIDGETYHDGGILMNTPLKPAIDAGALTFHVIYLDPDVESIPISRLQNTLDAMDRLFTILMASRVNRDIETAQSINHGIDILLKANTEKVPSKEETRSFLRVAGKVKQHLTGPSRYRKLRIHRYHPRDDLGGTLGLLNFHRDRVEGLIQRGFANAEEHDCEESECILPD
jgi:NTE family protein